MCSLHTLLSNSSHRPLCVHLHMCSLCVHNYRSEFILRNTQSLSLSHTDVRRTTRCGCLYHWQMKTTAHGPLNYDHTWEHTWMLTAPLHISLHATNIQWAASSCNLRAAHTHGCTSPFFDFLPQCDSISSLGHPLLMLWAVQTNPYSASHASERREPLKPS